MGAKSRRKGARGELEWAKFLTGLGFPSRRGQQYSGIEGEDVKTETLSEFVHWEVKRTEALSLYSALDQAVNDAGSRIPLIAHRRNNRPWLVVLRADDLLPLARALLTVAADGPGSGSTNENGTLSERPTSSPPITAPAPRAVEGRGDRSSQVHPRPDGSVPGEPAERV